MHHYEDSIAGVGGLQLFAQGWRPEESPKAALAIVHGFGEHSGRYSNVVNWFVPRGYLVCAFDLRGMGRSPGRRGHVSVWSELVDDVGFFLEWVKKQEPGGYPGWPAPHSYGAGGNGYGYDCAPAMHTVYNPRG